MLGLKRPFIWIARFRHRCGYGVHSPFAFSLITDVIYERRPYYAYRVLDEKYRVLSRKWEWAMKDTKVNRLLFRLVNRFQPEIILEASLGTRGLTLPADTQTLEHLCFYNNARFSLFYRIAD